MRIVFVLWLLILSISASADETLIKQGGFSCGKNSSGNSESRTIIYFLNGINNSKKDSQLSSFILNNRMYQNSSFEYLYAGKVDFKVLYNPTDNIKNDSDELKVQIELQKLAEEATETRIQTMNLSNRLPPEVLERVKKAIYSVELNEKYQSYWAETYAREAKNEILPQDPDGRRLIEHYQSLSSEVVNSLLQGNKVIIVAHSQGNYVAQGIYSYISNMPLLRESALTSLRVVGVANVAATTPNNTYTTLKQDRAVYLAHQLQGGQPMDQNFDAIFSNGEELNNFLYEVETKTQKQKDKLSHSFINTYMNASIAGSGDATWHETPIVRRNSSPYEFLHQKIVKDVIHGIDEAEFPPQIVNEGIISSTLTWLGNDDIDLHVNEPYEEVHYANQDGDIGFLDVDDYDGQGPEHYYGSCKNLIEFQNRNSFLSYFITFSVNQYNARKTEPENVTLYLSVGGYSLPIENFNLSPSFPRKTVYKLELFKKGESSTSMIFGFKMYKL